MAKYSIKGPDGSSYDIEGPDGASDEDVINAVLSSDAYKSSPGTQKNLQSEQARNPDIIVPGQTNPTPAQRQAIKPKSIWQQRLEEAQGVRPGLDPENDFGGPRVFDNGISNPLSTVRDIADLGARGMEYLAAGTNTGLDYLDEASRRTGLADALSVDGNKFLPGSAIGALMEAFPLGGAEVGLANPAGAAVNKLSPTKEAEYINVARTGTVDDIANFLAQEGHPSDRAVLEQFVKDREKAGGQVGDTVRYEQQQLPLEEQQKLNFNAPTPEQAMEAKLRGEAEQFQANKPQDTVPDVRQRELPLDKPAQQQSFDFGETAPKQKAVAPRDATPETVSPEVTSGVDHINEITKDWSNAPSIEVFDNFKSLKDVDPDAIGVTRPDGSVAINMENVLAEAEASGVSPKDVLSAVTFHESLGHYGLTQRFGEHLDGFLEGLYRNSDKFQSDVKKWMNDNPDAYADDFNPIARASEEVLAEMSEKGRISPTTMNRIRNWVKGLGREMGLQLKYSDREIKSILSMAHDAVVKGNGRDVALNGFRYRTGPVNPTTYHESEGRAMMESAQAHQMRPSEVLKQYESGDVNFKNEIDTRIKELEAIERAREASKGNRYKTRTDKTGQFRETRRLDDGTIFLEYQPSLKSSPIPIKMAIDNGVAEIAIDQFSTQANRLGISKVRDAMTALADMYPEIERFGGYRRSGAGKGRVQEIAVPERKLIESVNRYMKRRTVGKGSEGMARGSGINPEDAGTLSKFRSERPVEDILKEVAPEKESQSWDQWIDEAGKIKMTGKIAQNLAIGAEVPELKAAERFLLESSNRIFDLSRKVSEGRASERDTYLLGQEIERARNVSRSIQDVVSNAGRILNSRNIEVASDRALSDNIRNMLRNLDNADLSDVKTVQDAAKKLAQGTERDKKLSMALDVWTNAVNFPRAIMSSMDLSAPLRQGVFLIVRKEFWKGIPSMFKQFGDKEAFAAVKAEIESRPTYKLMERAGLDISGIGRELSKREENFMSNWAEKVPLVERSEKAYTGFLNKLRADVFDDLVRQYSEAGIDLKRNDKALHDVAWFVNNATGRGNLGKWTQAASRLNTVFFSPRLIASRVQLLNPAYYAKLDPIVRRNALKSLASFGGIATSVALLAKMMGAEVEADPRSSDFAKIKVDNTRYDILGGFGQYLTLGARLATNQKKDIKGEVVELGRKYGSDTRLDVLLKFGINKESPVASFVTDYLRGKNAIGEPFEARKAAVERMIPLFLQDATDLIKDQGAKGVPMSLPGLFGIGMNTYDVDLGYDAFGRDIKSLLKEGKEESDPVILEVQRLNTDEETSVLAAAPKSFKLDGVKHELTDEQHNEWQQVMGKYTHEYLAEDMKSQDYINGSDADKIEIIKEAHRDAYEDTKADMIDRLGLNNEGE